MARAPRFRLPGAPALVAALLFAGDAAGEILPPAAPIVASLDACIALLEAEDADARPEAGPRREFLEPGDEPFEAPREKGKSFAERCPEVHAGLAASALAIHLPPDWDRRVRPGKLRRYRALLTEAAAPAGRKPRTDAVAAIVKETEAAVEVQGRSLWQRFKDWLRSWLERSAPDTDSGWLARWLDEHMPSAKVFKVILYSLLVGMIGLAGWFIYAELRAAGLLERRRRSARGAAPPQPAEPAAPPTLAGASEAEAPSILLALLLGELRRLGRVQDRISMTHRELAGAVRFEGADGDAFRLVLGAAERLRYDAAPPPAGALRASIDAGKRLLESLVRQPKAAS